MVEVIVAHQATVGLAAELSVLFLVEALEERALVPGHTLVLLERAAQVLLADVHDPDLQHLVGFSIGDEILQAAPGPFELLELLVVENVVDLLGECVVDLGDDRLDGSDDIIGDDGSLPQRLLRERAYGHFDCGARLVGLGLELFL